MTREEAIKIIDCYDIGFYDLSGEKIPADKLAEAFDMAIEALSEDISEDGTLKVKVKDGSKVNRVLVWGDNIFGGLYYPEDMAIEALSADAIVRCKDCKEYDIDAEWCSLWGREQIFPNGYCSFGERGNG